MVGRSQPVPAGRVPEPGRDKGSMEHTDPAVPQQVHEPLRRKVLPVAPGRPVCCWWSVIYPEELARREVLLA